MSCITVKHSRKVNPASMVSPPKQFSTCTSFMFQQLWLSIIKSLWFWEGSKIFVFGRGKFSLSNKIKVQLLTEKGGHCQCVWISPFFIFLINFTWPLQQKGSSLQEELLSVHLSICPSSLFDFDYQAMSFSFLFLTLFPPEVFNSRCASDITHQRQNVIGKFILDPSLNQKISWEIYFISFFDSNFKVVCIWRIMSDARLVYLWLAWISSGIALLLTSNLTQLTPERGSINCETSHKT